MPPQWTLQMYQPVLIECYQQMIGFPSSTSKLVQTFLTHWLFVFNIVKWFFANIKQGLKLQELVLLGENLDKSSLPGRCVKQCYWNSVLIKFVDLKSTFCSLLFIPVQLSVTFNTRVIVIQHGKGFIFICFLRWITKQYSVRRRRTYIGCTDNFLIGRKIY